VQAEILPGFTSEGLGQCQFITENRRYGMCGMPPEYYWW